jgi:uncharacterized protein (DUF2147 family)
MSVDDPDKNEKVQSHEKVILLRDFERKSDSKFCCGTIYQPKHDRLLSASMKLEDKNTLKVTGKYGPFRGTQIWTKL